MKKLLLFLIPLIAVSCGRPQRFELISPERSDIDFANTIKETDSFNILKWQYIYNGAGVGAGDLNNDGLTDLVFAGNQVSPRVYLNLGNFRFRDITANFEGMTNDHWYTGVAIADVNNDGLADVYMTTAENKASGKCRNMLWINQGVKEGHGPFFKEMAARYGIADDRQSAAAAFFDYDLDGDLDLYLLNSVFNEATNAGYHPRIMDGSAPNNDRLYRNNGDGTFTDVTVQSGITYEGFGMGIAVSDINRDGYPDLYISNDFMSNDILYINQGDGTFRNEIAKYISYQSKFSKGNDVADMNNDGNPDIFTLDILPRSYAKKKQTINGFTYNFYVSDSIFGYEHQYLRNMLHLHNGFAGGEMLPFSEAGQKMGVSETGWSWSALLADFNNDGHKDLIVTNGFPRDLTDKDWTRFKVTAQGSFASDSEIAGMAPRISIPNVVFENRNDTAFELKNDWLPSIPSYSNGAVYADLDNDGDLDYVVNNLNDKAFIMRNNTVERSKGQAHYLRLKLAGRSGNTMGIGAKVEIWDQGRYQYAENFLTRGFASSVDPVIHFGLAGDDHADSVRVTWPDGKSTSSIKDIKADQTIEINEAGSHASQVLKKEDSRPLFTRISGLLDYTHKQRDFNDYTQGQATIPHKFSQIGPVMVTGDLDNDGAGDIIIGATNDLPTTVFLRKGDSFVNSSYKGLTIRKGCPESDLAVADMDGDGVNDVVVVAGGYEIADESGYTHFVYENRNGSFIAIPLPIPHFPASVVRLCDFNHDGNIEMFVGSRVKRGMYPYASHSWLIHNDKGKFTTDSTSRLNLGMVTDAVWTDFDGDGWEDLLVAREGNSLVMLKNINGKRLEPQVIPELNEKRGLWYSIAAGDFDGNGTVDYIVGNIGENNRYPVSEKLPMHIYAIDLDANGVIDPLVTAFWDGKDGRKTEYPVNYLDELMSQSEFFSRRAPSYNAFSYMSFPDLIGRDILKLAQFNLSVNTLSSYILWNDKGRFIWERLPEPVQLSPVTRMLVGDFNGDGFPDVVIGGNDYSYDVATGYMDANKGLLLLNSGDKKAERKAVFSVEPPSRSGLLLKGMVQSLLDFRGDSPFIVAGINRSEAVVYKYGR
jgi:enediyne biosynthesis protein E4